MEIAPSIHLVDSVRGVNVYLLLDRRLALIDTGMPGNASRILDYVRNTGRQPEELSEIILTHGHIDHAGSAAEVRRLTGARVLAHIDETAILDGARTLDVTAISSPVGRLLGAIVHFQPPAVDETVADGDVLSWLGGLRVIHTPGHTPGSISLLAERRRVLFVGDAVINNGDRLSRPLPFRSDKAASERSLRTLRDLDFDTCCFGHGAPLTAHAKRRVVDFVANPSALPLWRRVVRRRHTLARFLLRLFRR